MKTILYALIAILIFGTIATRFANKASLENGILIQSVEKNISSVSLSQSAKIISDRLKDYSSEKFDITINPEKNQIQVIFTEKWDLKTAENLLVKKGTFAFYETYDHKSLSELLNGDTHLFSLLRGSDPNNSAAKIGCTSIADVDKVNGYLNSLGLNQKCKFSWGQVSDNSEICLYALKSDVEKGVLLTGTDVESMKFNQDAASKDYYIEIRFNKSAAELWHDATKRNINHAIAIVLDENVICAPIVRSEINNGICQIAGDYTENQVRYFAAIGNNGVLPVSFKVVK